MTDFTLKYNGLGILSAATDEQRVVIDDSLTNNKVYVLSMKEDRSDEHHRWWFAVIRKAWATLPDRYGDRWPTAEHLRKWLLIRAGHCETLDVATDNVMEVAAGFRWQDPYAVLIVKDSTVQISRAKSQKYKRQDQEEFQEVTTRCIDLLAQVLGCEPGALLDGSDCPEWAKQRETI